MKSRYLCKHHFQVFCQNLDKAQRDWEHSMAMGLDAVNANQPQQAERCFGTAYEIANIIFDRQISNNGEAEIAANTLLSAQYLATSLVQQDYSGQAEIVLKQLHEKFSFVCRNPSADQSLRKTLCNCLIPYLEKLYHLALGESETQHAEILSNNLKAENFQQLFDSKRSSYYRNNSTLYH